MVRNNKQRNAPNFITTPLPSFLHPQQPNNEDFDECDVVWSDNNNDIPTHTITSFTASPRKFTAGISAAILGDDQPRSPTSVQRKTASSPVAMISSSYLLGRNSGGGFHMSAPVNVPIWPNSRPKYGGWGEEEGEVEEDEEMVPPHEIVARSRKSTAFSVIEGAGRTLKGRDMTRVRNAVFQKTGFID